VQKNRLDDFIAYLVVYMIAYFASANLTEGRWGSAL